MLGQCTFKKSRICSPFMGLLNDVLSILVNEDNEETTRKMDDEN